MNGFLIRPSFEMTISNHLSSPHHAHSKKWVATQAGRQAERSSRLTGRDGQGSLFLEQNFINN